MLLRALNLSSLFRCLTNSVIVPISYGWQHESRRASVDSLYGSKRVASVLVLSVLESKRGSFSILERLGDESGSRSRSLLIIHVVSRLCLAILSAI